MGEPFVNVLVSPSAGDLGTLNWQYQGQPFGGR
jgi:hypothetical protein